MFRVQYIPRLSRYCTYGQVQRYRSQSWLLESYQMAAGERDKGIVKEP